MLDRDERESLRQIEWQLARTDPELAAVLRDGQRRLARAGTRVGLRVLTALLVLLTLVLVVLGMVAAALAIAAVAAGLWRLREYRVILDES